MEFNIVKNIKEFLFEIQFRISVKSFECNICKDTKLEPELFVIKTNIREKYLLSSILKIYGMDFFMTEKKDVDRPTCMSFEGSLKSEAEIENIVIINAYSIHFLIESIQSKNDRIRYIFYFLSNSLICFLMLYKWV